jgi:4-hydroxybenzoate polyprenyltransferase
MATDIREEALIIKKAPPFMRPYLLLMRVDQSFGTLLILLPCLWGLLLGARTYPATLRFWIIFPLGALVMRSAGCIINDLTDMDFDARVTRTKDRPLASHLLTRTQALICLGSLLTLALSLLLALPLACWGLGVLGLGLVVAYPWMKRITYWPQIFLGLAMNWGLLMAVMATHQTLTPACGVLFLVGIGWTFIYDTLYAHQDRTDDLLIGLKSSAIALGDYTKPILQLVTLLLTLGCLFVGTWEKASFFYYAACLVGSASLMRTLRTVVLDDSLSCQAAFKECQVFGWMLFLALILA